MGNAGLRLLQFLYVLLPLPTQRKQFYRRFGTPGHSWFISTTSVGDCDTSDHRHRVCAGLIDKSNRSLEEAARYVINKRSLYVSFIIISSAAFHLTRRWVFAFILIDPAVSKRAYVCRSLALLSSALFIVIVLRFDVFFLLGSPVSFVFLPSSTASNHESTYIYNYV